MSDELERDELLVTQVVCIDLQEGESPREFYPCGKCGACLASGRILERLRQTKAELLELRQASREVGSIYRHTFDWGEPSAAGDAIRRWRALLSKEEP